MDFLELVFERTHKLNFRTIVSLNSAVSPRACMYMNTYQGILQKLKYTCIKCIIHTVSVLTINPGLRQVYMYYKHIIIVLAHTCRHVSNSYPQSCAFCESLHVLVVTTLFSLLWM